MKLEAKTSGEPLTLDEILDFPKEITGYACYYAENEAKFREPRYILVEEKGVITFISLNKKVRKITHISVDSISKNHFINNYKVDDFLIKVENKRSVEDEDGSLRQEGTITVIAKDGRRLEKNFISYCGD